MTRRHPKQHPIRVGLISLGCAKNLVDAEVMLGSLLQEGVEITNDSAQADVLVVNTCSFIDSAQEESVDAILEAAAARDRQRPDQGLIVAGCLPQRFREELPKLLPEVDAFIGIDQVREIPGIVRQVMARRADPATRPAPAVRKPGRAGGKKIAAAARVANPTPPPEPIFEVERRPRYIPDYATPRFRLTPRHFAYVKIAEGCNHPCSFCIIPRMRGTHRSRAQSDVLAEARQLVADGVKELNLISQDTTYYGLDLRPARTGSLAAPARFRAAAQALPTGATTLVSLLRELNELPGDFWVRLLYTHPAHWTDDLIAAIAECPKVARYVDMPLQHIHEVMLERMRRETSRAHIEDLIGRIRAGIPGIALRTTFIVGFPGETEACFESLLEFIRATKFDRLGVFTYSPEAGTRAAAMAGQVPEAERERRRDRTMAAQLEVARELAHAQVGRTLRVLVERETSPREVTAPQIRSWEHGFLRSADSQTRRMTGRVFVARGEADAPDIDGRVYVRGNLKTGAFARVNVVDATDYDLLAVPAGTPEDLHR